MPKSHGIKRKSRHIFTKGKVSSGLSHLLINYSVGDKVVIIIEDSKEGLVISKVSGEEQ
jgi:large subunit ribosomal protein L21e